MTTSPTPPHDLRSNDDAGIAGPFKNHPVGQRDESGGQLLRAAFHQGKWWQVARQFSPCPVCSNLREIVL